MALAVALDQQDIARLQYPPHYGRVGREKRCVSRRRMGQKAEDSRADVSFEAVEHESVTRKRLNCGVKSV
jgi:hypothetical protein